MNIRELYKEFRRCFQEEIRPRLYQYEVERRKKYKLAKNLSFLMAILAIIYCIWLLISQPNFDAELQAYSIMLTLLACFVPYSVISHNFEIKIKQKLMHILLKPFKTFEWAPKEIITDNEIKNSELFDNYTNRSNDDTFIGVYKDVNIILNETRLTIQLRHHTHTIFKGLIIKVDMNKNFLGRTLINPARKPRELEEVKLEDPDFSKHYKIYTSDQVEARYIFTTTFIERFKKIQDIFVACDIKAMFCNSSMFLAISTWDLFEVVSLSKSLYNTKQYENFFLEFCLIFELIDELKLNTKIGL